MSTIVEQTNKELRKLEKAYLDSLYEGRAKPRKPGSDIQSLLQYVKVIDLMIYRHENAIDEESKKLRASAITAKDMLEKQQAQVLKVEPKTPLQHIITNAYSAKSPTLMQGIIRRLAPHIRKGDHQRCEDYLAQDKQLKKYEAELEQIESRLNELKKEGDQLSSDRKRLNNSRVSIQLEIKPKQRVTTADTVAKSMASANIISPPQKSKSHPIGNADMDAGKQLVFSMFITAMRKAIQSGLLFIYASYLMKPMVKIDYAQAVNESHRMTPRLGMAIN